MNEPRYRYIVAYDISSDKNRTRVAKILDDYGARRQFSVFEVSLTRDEYARMRERLLKAIDEDEDALVAWMLCADCFSKTDYISLPKDKSHEDTDPDYLIF